VPIVVPEKSRGNLEEKVAIVSPSARASPCLLCAAVVVSLADSLWIVHLWATRSESSQNSPRPTDFISYDFDPLFLLTLSACTLW
jgi:hypothetical protein